jgi:predicted nucleic-acid-binding Zn-ribbon protein
MYTQVTPLIKDNSIQYIYFKDNQAVVTNGHLLIKVMLEDNVLSNVKVESNALSKLLSLKDNEFAVKECNGYVEMTNESSTFKLLTQPIESNILELFNSAKLDTSKNTLIISKESLSKAIKHILNIPNKLYNNVGVLVLNTCLGWSICYTNNISLAVTPDIGIGEMFGNLNIPLFTIEKLDGLIKDCGNHIEMQVIDDTLLIQSDTFFMSSVLIKNEDIPNIDSLLEEIEKDTCTIDINEDLHNRFDELKSLGIDTLKFSSIDNQLKMESSADTLSYESFLQVETSLDEPIQVDPRLISKLMPSSGQLKLFPNMAALIDDSSSYIIATKS